MTEKKKTLFKWIAIFTCVAVVTVGVTLAVCFSNYEKTGTREKKFYDFDTNIIATPYGDIFAMEEDFSFRMTSADQSTMVYGWSDKTFSVISQYGLRHVGKKVNRLILSALFLSHDGEAIYFIDNEEFNYSTNSLWFYNVKKDTCEKVDTIAYALNGGMVSPKGKYVALLEQGDQGTIVHLYDKGQKVKSYEADQVVQLCFVTDAGAVLYSDGNGNLKMLQDNDKIALTSEYTFQNVLINRDCTELIVNCDDGCYFYRLKNDVVTEEVKLLDEGNLTAYINTPFVREDTFSVLNVDSFCDVNLKNTSTQHRCKLTKDGRLIVQEGSDTMHGNLALGGAYMYYIDDNGDYFYTNTDDENGKYHLLWEASACDILPGYDLLITANRSVYYWDMERNLHYVNDGKDWILWPAELVSEVRSYAGDPFSDVIYWATEDAVYYSSKGKAPRKMFDIEDVFTEGQTQIILMAVGYDQVYCYAEGEDMVFCQLFANGKYHVMELVE